MISTGDLLTINEHIVLVVRVIESYGEGRAYLSDVASRQIINDLLRDLKLGIITSMHAIQCYTKNAFLDRYYEVIILDKNSRHVVQETLLKDLITKHISVCY